MPNENDANEEKETPADSSTEEKTSEETTSTVSEDDKTQKEEELGSGIDNYDSRFKQVYKNWKEEQRQRLELEEKLASKPDEPKEEEGFEPKTWDEVFTKVEERLNKKQYSEEERLNKKQYSEEERIKEVEKKITADIAQIKQVNPQLNEDEIWDYMVKNKITNVFEAYTKLSAKVDNKDNKQVASKIGSSSKNTSGKGTMSYDQLRKMSLDDIV